MPLLEIAGQTLPPAKGCLSHGKQLWEVEHILARLQAGSYFLDQITFVDMPLKASMSQIEAQLECAGQSSEALDSFFLNHFGEAGSDLVAVVPEGYTPDPKSLIQNIKNSEMRQWALKIHSTWLLLCRRVSTKVQTHPENHSLMYLPRPVMIPGSRFREVYYWDSYWIIRGLLLSQLHGSAQDTVQNLLWLLQQHGFVPNGARTYYLNRSQPPLLSQMVRAVYGSAPQEALLKQALPLLLQEHSFWTCEPHLVLLRDQGGKVHSLSRYYASWDKPRPESFLQDSQAASGLDGVSAGKLYREIASVAESGWDFSSRWMEDGRTLQSLRVTSVVPVDLNAFLFQMEQNVSHFASVLGEASIAAEFDFKAQRRREAMDSLLWSSSQSQWFDLWLQKGGTLGQEKGLVFEGGVQNEAPFASNFVPLWCGLLEKGSPRAPLVVTALRASGLILPAGVATSLSNTGEQWDYPNAWAPLQHMVIEGLEELDLPEASDLARDLASRFLKGVYEGFKRTGHMHEKYDARTPGEVGGGGEYEPQIGFGWTNGVTLTLLRKYSWEP